MPKYTKRSDGRYSTTVVVSHDSNGKPIKKTIYGKTQKELTNKIAELKVIGYKNEHSFADVSETWISEHEKIVGYNTMKGYKEALKKLYPLYDVPIENITAQDIVNIINQLHAQGLSKSLLKRVKLVYSLICNYAIVQKMDVVNYSRQISIPKNAKENKREDLTEEEIQTVKNNASLPFGE